MRALVREDELPAVAARLLGSLPSGAVLWLTGDLGAGKTTLARAIVDALGAREGATSPTFGLAHRYESPGGPVFHVDCYRLRAPEEAAELDWGEFECGRLLVVEWPQRGGPWVPAPTVTVHLTAGPDPETRQLATEPPGAA
jgi:tRNA threonylcarbamoyladenosine biosynthesis protein TsaE